MSPWWKGRRKEEKGGKRSKEKGGREEGLEDGIKGGKGKQ